MLHRVFPFENNKLFPNENMKITPEFLEKFIIDAKEKGYEFISMDELSQILKYKTTVSKKIVMTLDDGYKDNYTHAYPIFKKYNVPFLIYITTKFPDKKAILWWYNLEELVICNNEISLNNSSYFKCFSEEEKINTFMKIREIIMNLDQKNLYDELNNLFNLYSIDWYKYSKLLTLDWNEILELSNDSLCTIGGHTVNHFVLSKLNKDEIINEINLANKTITNFIKKDVKHFAYPFGDKNSCGKKEFDVVKELKLLTATTTISGHARHGENIYELRRLMLCEGNYIENTNS